MTRSEKADEIFEKIESLTSDIWLLVSQLDELADEDDVYELKEDIDRFEEAISDSQANLEIENPDDEYIEEQENF